MFPPTLLTHLLAVIEKVQVKYSHGVMDMNELDYFIHTFCPVGSDT